MQIPFPFGSQIYGGSDGVLTYALPMIRSDYSPTGFG
jgi:hypothetical protein